MILRVLHNHLLRRHSWQAVLRLPSGTLQPDVADPSFDPGEVCQRSAYWGSHGSPSGASSGPSLSCSPSGNPTEPAALVFLISKHASYSLERCLAVAQGASFAFLNANCVRIGINVPLSLNPTMLLKRFQCSVCLHRGETLQCNETRFSHDDMQHRFSGRVLFARSGITLN